MFLQAAVRTTCTPHNLREAEAAGNADSQRNGTRAMKGQPPGEQPTAHTEDRTFREFLEN